LNNRLIGREKKPFLLSPGVVLQDVLVHASSGKKKHAWVISFKEHFEALSILDKKHLEEFYQPA